MDLVKDSLSQVTYAASLAGLDYSLSNDSTGLAVKVGGYDDKLPLLLHTVLEKLSDIQFDPERLQVKVEQVILMFTRLRYC